MTLSEIQKTAKKLYYPLFLLEKIIPHLVRRMFASIFLFLFVTFAVGAFGMYFAENYMSLGNFGDFTLKLWGGALVSLSIWAVFFASNAFFYSFYFKRPKDVDGLFIDFDLAYSIFNLWLNDASGSFLNSALGRKFLLRSGIDRESVSKFLENRKNVLSAEQFNYDTSDNIFNLVDFISGFYDNDQEVKQFLLGHGIQKKDATHIAEWIMELHASKHAVEGWWRSERLSKVESIGEDWSYGRAFTLEKYSRPLPQISFLPYEIHTSYGENELSQIQSVLAKDRESNVILVGDDLFGTLSILSRLNKALEGNFSLPALKDKKIIVLDTDAMIAATGTKIKFESLLVHILAETALAGNVILAIDNMPSFISSARSLESDVSTLIEPYLSSSLSIIAISTVDLYHQVLEKDLSIMKYFEIVFMKEADDTNMIKILQNEAAKFEFSGLFFTYPALLELRESAERYFPNSIMPDKALDLLAEISSQARLKAKKIISKDDVSKLVEGKTGIPVSGVKENEKEKLLNMEEVLHSRIVGQNEAISAISNAMRRARSGLENPKRPLGSFLFLGPTGVGKTETTKALSSIFFGSEENVIRLDMSEYSSSDALPKLIGSFDSPEPGVLSSKLSEHPYGVLLLDEFEKANKEVMNLFLQVLDEGFFSDMKGKRVIARNLIIIATSNAGSDLIWQIGKEGKSLSENKDAVIDSIVHNKTFTPELLNRFDGVILFHPLSDDDLHKIAELSLKKLAGKLAEKGMTLNITDDLISYVVSAGSDPKFGARPINRAINEEVEEVIAKKIIGGSLRPGSEITLSREDLS